MPAVASPFPAFEAHEPVLVPRKRWTRDELNALADSGLMDQQKLELIEGDLLDKMGKKRRHVNALTRLAHWLAKSFGESFVNFECSIDVSPQDNPTSEPEPDIIVLLRPMEEFEETNPAPADLQLVVEVSDSTLAFDLTRKAALYARAGIQEYWVVDLVNERVIVHRDPHPGSGEFASVRIADRADHVAPLAAPNLELKVAEILTRRLT